MSNRLDTHVLSELRPIRAGRADAPVAAWANAVDASELFLSVITLQELEMGVRRVERRDAQPGANLRAWLENQVLSVIDGRMLPITEAVARRSARLPVPDPRPIRDGLMAATALVHQLTGVTRNVVDFEGTGSRVLNPWEKH